LLTFQHIKEMFKVILNFQDLEKQNKNSNYNDIYNILYIFIIDLILDVVN
jgi:hypothetical protein